MSQLNTYDIQRPTGECAASGRVLTPGETYYAVLVDPPEEERVALLEAEGKPAEKAKDANGELPLIRIDIGAEAWDAGFRPPHLFGYWRSVVPEPNDKKKLLVGNAAIQELMLSLADTEEDRQLAFRYVLALILLRKKLLRHDRIDRREDAEGDGPVQDWWLFTPKVDIEKGHFGKWNDEMQFEVLDPHIDATQIADVTEQLGQVLELDL
ncbi:MAG: hypothetical protein ACIAXF_13365 [Phycisphaerales bacterium JB063]